MSSLTFSIIILSLKALIGYGCLRTPTIELGPTIPVTTMVIVTTTTTTTMNPNPCFGSFTSGAGVTIVSEVPDASGVYMITFACSNGGPYIIINGGPIFLTRTFACGTGGKYLYQANGLPVPPPVPINTVMC